MRDRTGAVYGLTYRMGRHVAGQSGRGGGLMRLVLSISGVVCNAKFQALFGSASGWTRGTLVLLVERVRGWAGRSYRLSGRTVRDRHQHTVAYSKNCTSTLAHFANTLQSL
jgi:hypothetical protein